MALATGLPFFEPRLQDQGSINRVAQLLGSLLQKALELPEAEREQFLSSITYSDLMFKLDRDFQDDIDRIEAALGQPKANK